MLSEYFEVIAERHPCVVEIIVFVEVMLRAHAHSCRGIRLPWSGWAAQLGGSFQYYHIAAGGGAGEGPAAASTGGLTEHDLVQTPFLPIPRPCMRKCMCNTPRGV